MKNYIILGLFSHFGIFEFTTKAHCESSPELHKTKFASFYLRNYLALFINISSAVESFFLFNLQKDISKLTDLYWTNLGGANQGSDHIPIVYLRYV